jgi:hypothetical protein
MISRNAMPPRTMPAPIPALPQSKLSDEELVAETVVCGPVAPPAPGPGTPKLFSERSDD